MKRCSVYDPATATVYLAMNSKDEATICMTDEACDVQNGERCIIWGNPNFGVTSFDNIIESILNIFIIITLEGWTDTMYMIRETTQ